MKVKNIQLVNSITTLNKLLTCELNIKTQFNLDKNVKEIDKILESYNASRKKLIEKYCDKDKEGKPNIINNQYTFKENLDEFNKEFNELNSIENDVKIIKFSIDELEGVKVNSTELASINYMIK